MLLQRYLLGYTDESYLSMIAERIKQLNKLRMEFIDTLGKGVSA